MKKKPAQNSLCIEIGAKTWQIWRADRSGNISEPSEIIVPNGALWDPQAMSKLIKGQILEKRLLFLLNSAQTIVRVNTALPFERYIEHHATDMSNTKPEEYIVSRCTINDVEWTCGIPSEISSGLVEMCRLNGIRPDRIHTIDTIEFRMFCYLSRLSDEALWLFLPQEPGIRLITLQSGIVPVCYFFSNDDVFRVRELTRFWLCQPTEPQSAFILSDDSDYLWLKGFLEERSVEVQEAASFKRAMIGDWINA